MFSIQGRGIKHSNRVFMMFTDTPSEMNQWIAAIRKNVNSLANGGMSSAAKQEVASSIPVPATMSTSSVPASMSMQQMSSQSMAATAGEQSGSSVRQKVTSARDSIPFVHSGDSKLLEFWQVFPSLHFVSTSFHFATYHRRSLHFIWLFDYFLRHLFPPLSY